MTRHEIPRSKRCVAEECRSVWIEASLARPRWRTTRVQVCWRVVAGRGVWWSRAGNHQGRGRARPGDPPPLQGPCGQGHHAVLTACALSHPDQPPVGGKVRDLEMGPLPPAPSTGIDHPQTPPSCGVDDRGHQRADFLGTPHDGQLLAVPRPHAREDRPWSRQGHLIKKPDPLEVDTEGTLRDLLLMEQREHVRAALRFVELVRRAPVVWREVLDGLEVTRLGPGSEPTPRQVFEPTVSEGSHRHPPVHVGHDLVQKVCFEQEDIGSFRGAKEGRQEGTSTGETSTLPRSGFVQLLIRWNFSHITLLIALCEMSV
jgi:hypothetical protein